MQPSPLEVPQYSPEVQAAITAAKAVVENAKALGLVWSLRPATVTVDAPDPSLVEVIMDGDTVSISVVSLIGGLGEGARVMVLIVPPSGMFIIGQPNTGPKITPFSATNTADQALTTTPTGIVSTSITIPAIAGDRWKAFGVFDFSASSTGFGVAVGYLYLGITAETRAAIFAPASTGRSTVPQQWSGTFTDTGDATFVLVVQKTSAGGAVSAMQSHTSLEIETYSAGLVYPS